MASKKNAKQNKTMAIPKIEKETTVTEEVKEITETVNETNVEEIPKEDVATVENIEKEEQVVSEETVENPTDKIKAENLEKLDIVEDLNETVETKVKTTEKPKKPQPHRRTMREVYGYDWNGQIFDM